MKPNLTYLPLYFTKNAVISFFIVLSLCLLIYRNNIMPYTWIGFSILEVIGFFYFARTLSQRWQLIGVVEYRIKLFVFAFFLRLLWVVFSYFFFNYHTGQPFAFNAADELIYHQGGKNLAYYGLGNVDTFYWGAGISDRGFFFYLGIIYSLFGDYVLIPRIINAFLGAIVAILVYNIGKRNFGEHAGRIAGIFATLLPNLIYYTGLHLKEPVMVFMLMAFIDRIDYLLHGNKISTTNLLIIGLLGASMFYFRTVLALSAIFALFSALIFSNKLAINWMNRIMVSIWFLVVIWFFLSARIQGEISYYFQGQDQQATNMQFRADIKEGNKLATYGTTVVFLPLMFAAPFPTLVNIDIQKQQMLLSGGYFIRNVYAFFVILALVILIKRKMIRRHIFLLSFTFSYLFILAKSSFAISERFHLPVVPFLLILAAFGITQINKKYKKLFIPYLVMIVIIIIGWNWFKLAGRGAI